MNPHSRALAWSELRRSLSQSYAWRALAYADIRTKYRFSTLGTFWLTLSTGATAMAIGLIYGQFFGQDIRAYLPYFTTGLVFWLFISSAISEATNTLIAAGNYIKGSTFPVVFHILRMIHRQYFILLHNLVIVVLLYLFIRWDIGPSMLLSVVGFAIVYVWIVALSIILAMVSVRYRDVPPMIGAIMQFVFFATPVIWYPEQLKVGTAILSLNPVAHMIFIVREPLLGRPVALESWAFAIAVMAGTLVFAVWAYLRYRSRVAYWV